MKVKGRNKFYLEEKCKILGHPNFRPQVCCPECRCENRRPYPWWTWNDRKQIFKSVCFQFLFSFLFSYMWKPSEWMNGVCRKCAFHLKPPKNLYTLHDTSLSLLWSPIGILFAITFSIKDGSYKYIVFFKSKGNSQ